MNIKYYVWSIVLFVIMCDVSARKNGSRRVIHNENARSGSRKNNMVNTLSLTSAKPRGYRRIGIDHLKKMLQMDSDERIDTYYEPYWHSGEWVFLRITTVKGSPGPTPPTVMTGWKTKKFKKWPADIYRDCDIVCLNIYKDFYGGVCGQRFNTMKWTYEYKNFTNMCELEKANCEVPTQMWYPIHRDKYCQEDDTFKLLPSNEWLVLDRKSSWAPYTYERTTTAVAVTTPTTVLLPMG